MIVIKDHPLSYRDCFIDHKFKWEDLTIEFTEDEYEQLKDLILDTKENPNTILQAIIEEGLYSFMQGD